MISVEQIPVTKCIQVHHVSPSKQDTVQAYLENTRRSGGGPACQVQVFDGKKNTKILIFEFKDILCKYKHVHVSINTKCNS